MLSDKEYIEILEKLINTCAPKLAKAIRADGEFYGELLTSIMEADWKFQSKPGYFLEGFRKQMFLWRLGQLKRNFLHPKNHYLKCSNFDGWADYRYKANDINVFFEEFRKKIVSSKKLSKKERLYLTELFINMKSIFDLQVQPHSAKCTINRGIDKLEGGYGIFKLDRVRRYC